MEINYPLQVKKSQIDGLGAFALHVIPPHKKLGNLGGEIITKKKHEKELQKPNV